jgi:DnaK suppressor protein
MGTKVQAKKKTPSKVKPPSKTAEKSEDTAGEEEKESVTVRVMAPIGIKESPKEREARERRRDALQQMLFSKRQEILREIEESLGQSLTEDQQRRLESARDVGDQALMDLERELGISLMEMRNRRRQSIDEALVRLSEGTYGICAECGVEISEKRLEAVPFAKLCVECQSRQELLEKIEREEERD